MKAYLALDMDGVLLDCRSSWSELHRLLGVDNSDNMKLYKEKRITFIEFMNRDIELWIKKYGKLSVKKVGSEAIKIEYMPGIDYFVNWIDSNRGSVEPFIVTGSIDIVANRFSSLMGIDVLANRIMLKEDGTIRGDTAVVVDVTHKDEALNRYLKDRQSRPLIAVGDSEVDIPMFRMADYSIAFNPINELVEKNADYVIREKNLKVMADVIEKIVLKL